VLRLAPLKDIDVTLVPRVSVEELEKLPRHQFVRVTFPLDWMIADEAAVEFKPLVSPYGQLFPMASSNRLEAMDAVVNLRELHRLLTRAEADEGRRDRVAKFHIKHRKATEVASKVRQLLGLPADETPAAGTQTQLDIETAKFRSEAVKQLGDGAQKFLVDKPSIHLVVNDKENSILVNGRPDKIEIARQAIEAIDQPEPPAESSWDTLNRVKIYPVGGFDPSTITQLMLALQERGNLSKETRIQHEPAYNRLVVVASPQDQLTIANIIESFRTDGRRAEVLQLEQIDARYATNAIKLVLKSPSRPSSAPGPASEGQFQIEPDAANRRLLLWATPAEVEEVRNFLEQLGERFSSAPSDRQMHVVKLRGAKADDIMQRLKRVWAEISDAPLVIETGSETPPPQATPTAIPATPLTPTSETPPPAEPTAGRTVAGPVVQFAAQQQPVSTVSEAAASQSSPAEIAESKSPVRVIAGDDDMIIVSRDAAAAEAAKLFVEQIVPAKPDVHVISLKHAQAILLKVQLDALVAHTRSGDYSPLNSEDPLTIEADSRTNRLIIQHASPKQLKLIDAMVQELDQPEQEDARLVRQQKIYQAKRKRASEIAEVVKEVYRDLLSASDEMFDNRAGGRPFGYTRAMAATSKSPEYQGLLSIGVDDVGNMLVLSAPAYLMDEVIKVVELIDSSASSETVVVVPVSKAARQNVGEALSRLLAKPQ
jgi:type II secretory pathway component GspD/PulD (secretin)